MKKIKNSSLFHYTFAPIIGGILQLFSIQALTWSFPSDFIGMFYLLVILINFSLLILSFGLDQSYAREFHHHDNKLQLFIHSAIPGLMLLLFLGIVLFIFNPEILSVYFFSIRSIEISILIFLCILFEFINRFIGINLRMFDQAFKYSLIQFMPRAIFFVMIVTLYFLLEFKEDFTLIIFLHLLSVFFTFLVAIFFSYGVNKNQFSLKFDSKIFIKIFKFGLPFIFSGIAIWCINSVDKVFLRAFDLYHELALLSVSASISLGATFLASIFNTIWMPLVYKWNARGVKADVILEISNYATIVIASLVIFMISISWIFPFFFPPDYSTIEFLIVGSMLGPFLYSFSEITGVGIAIERKTNYLVFISIASIVSAIISSWYLIPIFGAKGAISSVTISYLVYFLIRTHISLKILLKLETFRINFSAINVFIITNLFLFYGELLPDFSYAILFIVFILFIIFNINKLKNLYIYLTRVELFN